VLCLLGRQTGKEVTRQGLFCLVSAQIVLGVLDHQAQPYQWIPQLLLQLLEQACCSLIYTQPLTLMIQVTCNNKNTTFKSFMRNLVY
jgi:hypothetical protein